MARRSPQTERLVEIVEFLAEHPEGRYRLADLARLIGTDKASCYPMLTELTRLGWLIKDPRKKFYRLGPALVQIGTAAAASHRLAETARRWLVRLSEELHCVSCLIEPSSTELVVADVVVPATKTIDRLDLQPGDRVDFRPPLGSVFVAWSNFYAVDVWQHRDPSLSVEPQRFWRMLQAVRERHFAVELFPPADRDGQDWSRYQRPADLYGSRRVQSMQTRQAEALDAGMLLTRIEDGELYDVLSINAAVFDSSGEVIAAVCLLDSAEPITGHQVATLGHTLAAAADEITVYTGGRPPWRR